MRRLFFLSVLMLLLAMGCDRKDGISQKLDSIDRLCDSDPHLAISMLDSIHPAGISSKERHYYDLLTIKSRDKAYIRHTSDSLILDVIDYYSSHRKEGLYAQALYYGGRVYSDLGDLPTALEYFQNALDCKPEIDQNLQFKSAVLSQTGRLLEELKLHDQAIAYIKEALACSSPTKDSLNNFYDHMLLAHIYLKIQDKKEAKIQIDEASKYTAVLDVNDQSWLEALRVRLTMNNNIDSALTSIRDLPKMADSLCRPFVVSVASKVYRNAGIKDTAYQYARELAFANDLEVSKSGFQVLFSDSMSEKIPTDSVIQYAKLYRNTVDSAMQNRSYNQVLLQNAKYNYAVHKRESDNAKTVSRRLALSISLLSILLLGILSILVWTLRKKKLSSRNSRNHIQSLEMSLHKSDDEIESLKDELSKTKENLTAKANELHFIKNDKGYISIEKNVERNRQKKELLDRFYASDFQSQGHQLPAEIKESQVYRTILERLDSKKGIPSTSKIWNSIGLIITEHYPDLNSKLEMLTNESMTQNDYQTVYLIKLGFTPLQSAILCCVSKSSMSTRRNKLCKLIFLKDEPLSRLDDLIFWL